VCTCAIIPYECATNKRIRQRCKLWFVDEEGEYVLALAL